MERAMLGITMRDNVRNSDLRNRTQVTDVMSRVAKLKWQWVGPVARENNKKCSPRITNWKLQSTRITRDKNAWKHLEETCVQQSMNTN